MADLGFDGKVAIITGAGGGLGRSHALELARRGALGRRQRPRAARSTATAAPTPRPRSRSSRRSTAAGGEAVANTDSVSHPRGRRGHRADGARRLRPRRHRHQQRRHPARQDVPQHDARPARPRARRAPEGRLQRHPPGLDPHPRAGLRPRRQHHVGRRHLRQLRPDQLRRGQDGPRRPHPRARRRGRQGQHQGQRHRPGRQDPHDRGAPGRARSRSSTPSSSPRSWPASPTRTAR